MVQQLKRQVVAIVKRDVEAFYLDEGTHVQWLMHKHRERKAYLRVLWLTGIYSGKRPNEHVTIVDAKGKRVVGTREKLEVCAMFFDKLYN